MSQSEMLTALRRVLEVADALGYPVWILPANIMYPKNPGQYLVASRVDAEKVFELAYRCSPGLAVVVSKNGPIPADTT